MDEWLMPGIPRTIAEDPDMETVRRIRASVTSDTGQVVESDLLEPCPFCGARPYVQVHELGETCVEARVVCPSCHVSTTRECQSWRVWFGEDELTRTLAIGRAISLWNRRAERTCQIVVSIDRNRASYGGRVHRCSSCGKAFPKQFFSNGWTRLNYCPTCGARVIGTISREEA